VPLGIRLWRKGGPSKVALTIGLLSQAQRRGLQPAYVLCDSWDGATQVLNVLDSWGWKYVIRLKSNRKLDKASVQTKRPHRYGQAQGELHGVRHPVLAVNDGRRYWGTNALTLTPRALQSLPGFAYTGLPSFPSFGPTGEPAQVTSLLCVLAATVGDAWPARGTKATRPLVRGTNRSLPLAFSFFIRGGDAPRHDG
jgi:hypothetical protein